MHLRSNEVKPQMLPLHKIERGHMPLPEGPGLGVTVDTKKVEKYRV